MSKAFTREDDTADEGVAALRPLGDGPVRLTRGAVERLRVEFERPEAPTDDPMRRRRVADALQRAEVVPAERPSRAVLGATVTVESEREGVRRETLVSPEEFDLVGSGCSVASPMGRGLLGASVGDEVTIHRPRGRVTLRVVSIER